MFAFQSSQSSQSTKRDNANGKGDAATLIQPKEDGASNALLGVQPKLRIGAPGDRFETEADSAAEKVQRGESVQSLTSVSSGGLGAQRKEASAAETQEDKEEPAQTKAIQRMEEEGAAGGEEEKEEPAQTKAIQRMEEEGEAGGEEEKEEPAQTKAIQRMEEEGGSGGEEDKEESGGEVQAKAVEGQMPDEKKEKPAKVQRKGAGRIGAARKNAAARAMNARGQGKPLPAASRAPMEASFGVDLGAVRVQKDGRAQDAAANLNARAFTKGKEIFLGKGESDEDLGLMAHETAHVLQQDAIDKKAPQPPAEAAAEPAAKAASDQAKDAAKPGSATPAGAPAAALPGDPKQAAEKDQAPAAGKNAAAQGPAAAPAGGSAPTDGAAPTDAGKEEAPAEAPAEQAAAKEGEEKKDTKGKEDAKGKGKQGEGKKGGEKEAEDPAAAKAKREAKEKRQIKKTVAKAEESAKQQQGAAAAPASAQTAATGAASSASAAAPSPANEADAMGQATQVDSMDQQEAGEVDQKSFLDVVKDKLREMDMPSSPDEMDSFKSGGGASGLKGELTGEVNNQKDQAAGAVAETARAEPTPAEPRQPEPLAPQPDGPPAADIGAKQTAPKPLSDSEVSLEGGRDEVEGELAKENLSKERLQKANDPRFTDAQSTREEVHHQADTLPQQYRKEEQATVNKDKAALKSDEAKTNEGMKADRSAGNQQVAASQQTQMTQEEATRKKIADDLQQIYDNVKKDVDDKLNGLDGKVDEMFTEAEKEASAEFEDYVEDEFEDWKDDRYSGLSGLWSWAEDQFRDINELPEVKRIYERGQDKYFEILDAGIDGIGKEVDSTLAWCKQRIATGAQEVKDYLANLDEETKKLAGDAAEEVMGKFADLKTAVDDKRDALADAVVQRYQQSREKLNARIEEIKEANRSFVVKAVNKVKGVLEAIDNFRKRLMSLLAKAADVVEKIIDDPIGFLGNLIKAVKQGFELFKTNIVKHLKAGIFGWLFGTFASKGIDLPSDFSLKSILGFLFQLMGITPENMRKKAVKLVGARNAAVIEQVIVFMVDLFNKGPMGIWEEIKASVGNLKEMIMEEIQTWIITKIVTSAITKLVSMFNPAGAIVQAVLTIYNVIMFFVERIEQIMQLVETIVNSLGAIVAGQVGAAAKKVEQVMGQMIPLMIAFLARLIGVGGIAGKVMKVIKKFQRKVDKAIDKLLKKVVKKIKGLLKKGKAAFGKAKGKVKKAVASIFSWWKEKRKFKADDGKSHKVYFKGKAKKPKIMVASSPRALEDYINKVKDKTEKQRLKDEMNALNTLIANNAKKKTPEKQATFQPKVQAKLKAIADALVKAKVLSADEVPPTAVSNKLKGGKAGEVLALPLSTLGGNTKGSGPGEDPKGWNLCNIINNSTLTPKGHPSVQWVRMHLLNDNLHGPGVVWNLTPGRQSTNSDMKVSPEKKGKDALAADPQGTFVYETKVSYLGAKDIVGPSDMEDPTSPDKKYGDEADFPAWITIFHGKAKKSGKKYVADGKKQIWKNPKKLTPPDPKEMDPSAVLKRTKQKIAEKASKNPDYTWWNFTRRSFNIQRFKKRFPDFTVAQLSQIVQAWQDNSNKEYAGSEYTVTTKTKPKKKSIKSSKKSS